tara:strand:- start:33 stop:389 length:357 start_codon:yes stop_codon:yes gene_type:complete
MATPNIANVVTIKPVMKVGELTTSYADLCDVPAESCMKIESIYVSNVDGTNSATAEITISTDNGSSNYGICKDLVVPPGATIGILTTPLFLDETDLIKGKASAASDIQWFISGTELID